MVVRQTFLDRETETPADLRIERINCSEDERRPSPLTPEQLDEGLKAAGTLVAGAPLLFAKWARDFQKHTNQLPMFDPEVSLAAGGDPNIGLLPQSLEDSGRRSASDRGDAAGNANTGISS